MSTPIKYNPLRHFSDLLMLLASCTLILAVSLEVICGDNRHFSTLYLNLQFGICCIFLFDLGLRALFAPSQGWYWLRNWVFLLLAIPWLNLAVWGEWSLSRAESMAIAAIPLVRSFWGLYVVVRWLVGGAVKQLLLAYMVTVVCFTYLSALLFYDYEVLVNPHLHGFGNALWWAWMNVTTVGAAIFPVTAVGKVLCVLLPILGMAMFPIFTLYVTSLYNSKKS